MAKLIHGSSLPIKAWVLNHSFFDDQTSASQYFLEINLDSFSIVDESATTSQREILKILMPNQIQKFTQPNFHLDVHLFPYIYFEINARVGDYPAKTLGILFDIDHERCSLRSYKSFVDRLDRLLPLQGRHSAQTGRAMFENQLIFDNPPVQYRDLLTMDDHEYFSDVIINYFLRYQLDQCGITHSISTVLLLDSRFHSALMKANWLTDARSWSHNIFDHHLTLIPVRKGSHWLLAAIYFPDDSIEPCLQSKFHILTFDSLNERHTELYNLLTMYLIDHYRTRYYRALAATHTYICPSVPLQTNEYDCGVYLIHFAQILAQGFRQILPEIVNHPDQPGDIWKPTALQNQRFQLRKLLVKQSQKCVGLESNSTATVTPIGSAGGCRTNGKHILLSMKRLEKPVKKRHKRRK